MAARGHVSVDFLPEISMLFLDLFDDKELFIHFVDT